MTADSAFVTRFAPSPTGPLHLGHAYSAMLAHDMAQAAGGRFVLRIEDIDQSRARAEWEAQIYTDLDWLGLHWETPVMRQSERMQAYRDTLDQLWWDRLLYVCTCNRRDIQDAASAPQEGAPLIGADGIVYPGTCRNSDVERDHYPSPAPIGQTLRLDMGAIAKGARDEGTVAFQETGLGPQNESGWVKYSLETLCATIGDVVLARRDIGASYHLAVVLDDAAQGITDVVRGADLFEATAIHVALQRLLDLPVPRYHHHRLIRDDSGKRLAKRDDARAISKYREDGYRPQDIRTLLGLETPPAR